MRKIFIGDLRRPLAPAGGIVLGAAGRRRPGCPAGPELCRLSSGILPAAGNCPCGAVPRPL